MDFGQLLHVAQKNSLGVKKTEVIQQQKYITAETNDYKISFLFISM